MINQNRRCIENKDIQARKYLDHLKRRQKLCNIREASFEEYKNKKVYKEIEFHMICET